MSDSKFEIEYIDNEYIVTVDCESRKVSQEEATRIAGVCMSSELKLESCEMKDGMLVFTGRLYTNTEPTKMVYTFEIDMSEVAGIPFARLGDNIKYLCHNTENLALKELMGWKLEPSK
jgi:hypothetical protein